MTVALLPSCQQIADAAKIKNPIEKLTVIKDNIVFDLEMLP